ncbi:MAG: hypothetical protein KBT11_11230 [Treponema sp.]|nr:hypothetical protein [Candidatus Treponema equifaecale]
MNHIAHKLCGTMASKSFKCSVLIGSYEAEFENKLKKQLYDEARFVHRHQNGIIKVTKLCWKPWKVIKKTRFSKLEVEVKTASGFYDPLEDPSTEERYVWFMNHADTRLFNSYSGDSLGTDDMQVLQMPLLASIEKFMSENKEVMEAKTVRDGLATPFLFEGIPFWISIDYNKLRKDGRIIRSMYNQDEKFLRNGFKVYQADFKANLISIKAPHGGEGEYTEEQIVYIFLGLIVGYSGLVKQTRIKKASRCALHTGNWGAGNFGGNLELMYLIQMYAASLCGIDEMIFHAVKNEVFEKARNAFEKIPEELTFEEAVWYFLRQKYKWAE